MTPTFARVRVRKHVRTHAISDRTLQSLPDFRDGTPGLNGKYEKRENSMEVVCSFGDCKETSWCRDSMETGGLFTKPVSSNNNSTLEKYYKYMFQKLPDVVEGTGSLKDLVRFFSVLLNSLACFLAFDAHCELVGMKIAEKLQIEEFGNVRQPYQVYLAPLFALSNCGILCFLPVFPFRIKCLFVVRFIAKVLVNWKVRR